MDVFETREEREAREQAAKAASWAKEVETAQKKDPTKCSATVYGSHSSFHGSRCSKPAKFHREEHVSRWDKESPLVTVHYCGTHDPISQRARDDKRRAEETRAWEVKNKRDNSIRDRQNLISRVVGHLTDEQLLDLEGFLSSTEFAKAVRP